MATEPTLSEVIRDAIEARLVDVHTLKVGRVESYDPDLQVADILPVINRAFNIGDGAVDYEELPVIPNVPVIWPRAGGFYMHMPLRKGDHIVIGFTDDDIAAWRDTGSTTPPDDSRRHALGSCLAFPGIAPALGFLSINPLDAALRAAGLCLGEDGTERQISWSDDAITVGRPEPTKRVSFVALADRTEARIQALEAQVEALTTALTALTATVAADVAAGAALTTSVGGMVTSFGTHTHNVPAPVSAPTGPPLAAMTAPGAPGGPPGPPPPAFVPNPLPVAADILKGTGPLP